MARTTKTIYTCDMHDGEQTEGVKEISFALDGTSYELDACEKHADELREAFAPYVGHARPAGRSTGTGTRRGTRSSSRPTSSSSAGSDRDQVQAIREWARENGHKVSERGRLSASVLEAYRAAH